MKTKDMELIALLRQNARATLTKMSVATGVPISTIYDKLKGFQGTIVRKHAALLDFVELGYNARAHVIIKIAREKREELLQHFLKNQNINNVCKINNGYDFMIEAIFKNLKDFEDYMDYLEAKYAVKQKIVYFIIDEPKKEGFLTDSSLISL